MCVCCQRPSVKLSFVLCIILPSLSDHPQSIGWNSRLFITSQVCSSFFKNECKYILFSVYIGLCAGGLDLWDYYTCAIQQHYQCKTTPNNDKFVCWPYLFMVSCLTATLSICSYSSLWDVICYRECGRCYIPDTAVNHGIFPFIKLYNISAFILIL